MIVYSSTKAGFNQDVISNQIDTKIYDLFQKKLGHKTSKSEIASWKNSLMYMNNILVDKQIPDEAGVAIEYRIPQSSKRVDFIITGKNEKNSKVVIIVEIKQWSQARLTDKDAIIETFLGGNVRETSHPSYQAWTYASLLENFNQTIEDEGIQIKPCAYLHNYTNDNVIRNDFYKEHIEKAPVFLREDSLKLSEFIKKHVKHGDKGELIYQIDNGKIRPSKNLADNLVSMLKGNKEFLMIDDQKLVYETALSLAKSYKNKNVLIVEGGPGSGKSVVAVNLLVEFINKKLTSQYITKNAAPRAVYETKLTGSFKKSHISNLFVGSGNFTKSEKNEFDTLIIDEAHRLNEKSGLFSNLGENQIKEIINASVLSVFFIDENQKVTFKDIGEKEEIIRWAKKLNANITELELPSQFRCNGSDGYISWLDNALEVKETANLDFKDFNFDFKVFNDAKTLREFILEKNKINNKARLVAGYCWDWESKKNKNLYDIEIGDLKLRWNLAQQANQWIILEEAVEEVGCIHTCQGLEVDYIGVIIGPDFVVRNGEILTDGNKRSKMDQSIKGFKGIFKKNPNLASKMADSIIKNTYRTLMTRGAKGCYIYCTDQETNDYFKKLISS